MIELEEVIQIHEILIQTFGGSSGIRDKTLLESALERPFSGFGQTEFHKTIEEKAAALLESIITNHPFIDGNKRIGYVLMRLLLLQDNKDIQADQTEKYEFIIKIASGQIKYPEILLWIQKKIILI